MVIYPWSHLLAGFIRARRLLPFALACAVTLLAGTAVADSTFLAGQSVSATVTGPAAVTLNFPITRGGDLSYNAWVSYATQDGTAVAGTDYTAASGTIQIPAGATSVQIPVSILGKSVNDPDKYFTLNLTGVVGTEPFPSFASQHTFTVGSGPHSVTAVDLNGAGKPDLVIVNYESNSISVLMNTTATGAATPSFAAQQPFAVGNVPTSVTAADLNGDGKPDLIVTNFNDGTISVLMNTTVAGTNTAILARQTFSVGHGPFSVTTADLNGDGLPDLIVANQTDNTISVLMNTTTVGAATASFAAPKTFTVGTGPSSVTAADLNGNGLPDLIVANKGSNTISVLMNTTAPGAATASFAAQQTFAVGPGPISVTTADLNGNGRADVIVANETSATISVLMNTTAPGTAAASFAAQQIFLVGGNPQSVTAVDLNGDGKPDLVTANSSGGYVAVLMNTTVPGSTTATFDAGIYSVGSGPVAAIATDLNGDGKPDLAVANFNDGTVSVLMNVTAMGIVAPSFAAAQTFAAGMKPISVTTADLNGNGRADVIVANEASDSVSVFMNTTAPGAATASFAAQQTFTVGSVPESVTTADLNGDGLPDLIVANTGASGSGNTVSVLMNTTAPGAATPSFAAQQTFAVGSGPTSVTAADLNGDGKPDLIVTNFNDGTVSVLMNTTATGAATASFAAQQTFTVGSGPNSVTTADLNGDGLPDIVVANFASGTVSVLMNTTLPGAATASFAAQQTFTVGTGPVSVTTADLNGDGLPDLIVTNQYDNTISVLMNTTAPGAAAPSFAAQQTFAVGTGPESVTTADLNGDGLPDLIIANWGSGSGNTVSVLTNTAAPGAATASFATQQTFAVGSTPISITTADLNGDGKPDLVAALSASGLVSVLLNTTFAASLLTDNVTGTIHYNVPVPAVSLAPASLAFGTVALGAGSTAQTVTLTNTGNASLTGLAVNLAGADPGDFTDTSTCPASLPSTAGSNSCSISVTFKPTANGARSASLSITSNAASSPNTVTLSGTGDAPPVASNQSLTLYAGQSLSGQLTAVSANGQVLTYAAGAAGHGTVTATASGSFTYTPASGYTGSDSFTFTANDGTATSNTATVTLTVNPVPVQYAVPVASNENLTTYAGQTLSGQLSAVASNGHALTYAAVTQPAHGTLTLTASTGAFTYAPASGYTGSDSFTFNANDGTNTSNTATVSLTVNPAQVQYAAPVASNENLTTYAGQTLSGQLAAVASNGHALTYAAVTQPAHGTLTLTASTGAFTYASASGYTGSDSFTFTANDGTATSNTATVTLTVNAVPVQYAAPVASNENLTTYAGQTLSGQLSAVASNGHALSYAAVTQPAHGTLTLTAATGAFTYAPASGYTGSDSFTFTANDGSNTSNTATVSITVNPVPVQYAAPVASNENLTTYAGQTLSGQLAAVASNGHALSYAAVTQPGHGTLTLTASTGAFTYAPASGYTGSDSFTFTATDGTATSNTATVNLTVNAVPVQYAAPVASNENLASYAGQTLSGQLSAVASNGHALSYAAVTQPAHGTLTLTASSGAFTYLPKSGYTGSDSFTFTASDGTHTSNTATVNLTVSAVPVQYAAPVSSNENLSTYAGQTLSGQLAAVASNGHALAYATIAQPSHGTLTLTASTGAFTYAPASGYTGSDSFTFDVNDGTNTSNTATVSITVNAAPTQPPPPAPSGGGKSGGGGGLGLLSLALLGLPLLRRKKA